ncbi:LacI family DNA-binding transcriptional regulator [Pusillimonas sp. SM2304]|uniref:LacI family DNA-binding transcriptional regulator n=1 Tax=Pusillimonas sp. SM2304 TaxID=3073241 RepID=UPI0028740705|nr:LacI family DNA-binding transcriptional regulator [Pusillimonas sp. SM2304]MDS1139830.1 LacI family DNA-binding transcriptional regulator [Pusillimonas sp. SM2304]
MTDPSLPATPPVSRVRKPRASSRATGRVTLADVAAIAGVSPITASRVVSGKARVDPELARRVRAAVEKLGYRPDPSARALASAKSTHVVVLIPMLSNTLFTDLLEAVQESMWHAGYQVFVGITHYQPAREAALLESYLSHRPAGIILTGLDRSQGQRKLIQDSRTPCVHVMELSDDSSLHCVGFSQDEAARAVAGHLLARGRKKIAFVGAQLDPRTIERAGGFRSALQEARCYDPALEILSPKPSSVALGAECFEQLMSAHPDIDAIFFCNDDLAHGGLLQALRMNVSVPGRVSIVGFNDLPGNAQMLPALSSLRTPRREIGLAAADMLLKLMRGDSVPEPAIDLGFELMVRESS